MKLELRVRKDHVVPRGHAGRAACRGLREKPDCRVPQGMMGQLEKRGRQVTRAQLGPQDFPALVALQEYQEAQVYRAPKVNMACQEIPATKAVLGPKGLRVLMEREARLVGQVRKARGVSLVLPDHKDLRDLLEKEVTQEIEDYQDLLVSREPPGNLELMDNVDCEAHPDLWANQADQDQLDRLEPGVHLVPQVETVLQGDLDQRAQPATMDDQVKWVPQVILDPRVFLAHWDHLEKGDRQVLTVLWVHRDRLDQPETLEHQDSQACPDPQDHRVSKEKEDPRGIQGPRDSRVHQVCRGPRENKANQENRA